MYFVVFLVFKFFTFHFFHLVENNLTLKYLIFSIEKYNFLSVKLYFYFNYFTLSYQDLNVQLSYFFNLYTTTQLQYILESQVPSKNLIKSQHFYIFFLRKKYYITSMLRKFFWRIFLCWIELTNKYL